MDKVWREGHFVWRELVCPDVARAKAFYGDLFGWTFDDMNMGDVVYTVAKRGDIMVGGLFPTSGDAMGPPSWVSYVSVRDVDAAAAAAEANGGKVFKAPFDIEGVGRLAILGDSTGAGVAVMCSTEGDGPKVDMPPIGTFCWETLTTTDVEKSRAFYTAVIGWGATEAANKMRVFTAGETQVADVQDATAGAPSHWLSHVVVERLEASRDKAERLGAKILVPVVDIPKIGRISVIADPLGAALSLFEPGAAAA